MLKKLRNKKTAKKVWIILAILIVPAFVLWGSGSLMRSKEEAKYTGRVFGSNISPLEFQDALSAVKNQALIQFGDKFFEVQKQLDLNQQALQRIILLREAKKRRIRASDKEVVEIIESLPFFQRAGRFDNMIYTQMLQYQFRTQPRIFEEETRQNIMLSKLFKQVTKSVSVNDLEIRNEYRKSREEVSVYTIVANPSDFTRSILPSEQDLKDFFRKNPLDFKQPLSFNLDYIELDSADKIKDAARRINKKESIEKIAKDLGAQLKVTGLFGQTDPIPEIGWSPDIMNLILKLRVGQYSVPIKLDKNFYILKLKEKKDAYIPEFTDIKDKVRDKFIKTKAQEAAKNKIDDCYRKLKESYLKNTREAGFERIAASCGLKSGSTGMFKYGSYIEGIGGSDILWLKASELKEGEPSEPINTPSGFYIIKVKSRVPVDEKKFESEKADFARKVLEAKQEDYFAKFVQSLLKRM